MGTDFNQENWKLVTRLKSLVDLNLFPQISEKNGLYIKLGRVALIHSTSVNSHHTIYFPYLNNSYTQAYQRVQVQTQSSLHKGFSLFGEHLGWRRRKKRHPLGISTGKGEQNLLLLSTPPRHSDLCLFLLFLGLIVFSRMKLCDIFS